jgi:hypothetical protein
MTVPRYTAADVRKAMRARYAPPEWALFDEVRDSTGGATRSADALAMNLFPSRGLRLHGFEIKVSRSDWLHELKQPHKSEAIQRFCDHWWIVTPADIVKDGELPPTWGHLILKGNGLNCAAKAPDLGREPWTPAFLAALLRRAHEAMERGVREGINAAMAGERAAISAEVDKRVAEQMRFRQSRETEATNQLQRIKDASGLADDPDGWFDAEGFGRAVGLVHRLGVARSWDGIASSAARARQFADAFSELEGSFVAPASVQKGAARA